MWTRSSDRWAVKPGNFDTIHASRVFPSRDLYGIPFLYSPKHSELSEPPESLIPYNVRVRSELGYKDAAMHFFIDDYRFETCWNKPQLSLTRIKQAWCVLTPDFSLYIDFPIACQIWNTYRNRWLGAFWKSHGLVVIPTIAWSTPASYSFCFNGVEVGSPVAVSYQGIRKNRIGPKNMFADGYKEMMRRIQPRFVMCYGNLPDDLKQEFPNVQVKCYSTFWENLRLARKNEGHIRKKTTNTSDLDNTSLPAMDTHSVEMPSR